MPWFFIQLRYMKPFLSAVPNHWAERSGRFASDIDFSLPFTIRLPIQDFIRTNASCIRDSLLTPRPKRNGIGFVRGIVLPCRIASLQLGPRSFTRCRPIRFAPRRMPFNHTLQQAERAQERSYHDAGPPGAQRAVERDERLDGPENADAEDRSDH